MAGGSDSSVNSSLLPTTRLETVCFRDNLLASMLVQFFRQLSGIVRCEMGFTAKIFGCAVVLMAWLVMFSWCVTWLTMDSTTMVVVAVAVLILGTALAVKLFSKIICFERKRNVTKSDVRGESAGTGSESSAEVGSVGSSSGVPADRGGDAVL